MAVIKRPSDRLQAVVHEQRAEKLIPPAGPRTVAQLEAAGVELRANVAAAEGDLEAARANLRGVEARLAHVKPGTGADALRAAAARVDDAALVLDGHRRAFEAIPALVAARRDSEAARSKHVERFHDKVREFGPVLSQLADVLDGLEQLGALAEAAGAHQELRDSGAVADLAGVLSPHLVGPGGSVSRVRRGLDTVSRRFGIPLGGSQ